MEKIRAAVIGAGYISRGFHCPALGRLSGKYPALDLAAICDTVPGRAAEVGREFGFRTWYESLDSLLEKEEIDAAWILTPPASIPELALRFIGRGIPLFLEKPPGSGSADVERLISAAAEHKVPCLVALNRRFIPLVKRFRELIGGPDNPVQAVEGLMLRHGRRDEDFGYGTAVHALDMMRHLGGDARRVEVNRIQFDKNERPSYFVDYHFRSGARGRLSILPEAGLNVERYTVHAHGVTAILEAPLDWTVDYPGRILYYNGRDRHFIQDNRACPSGDSVEVTGFLGESEHFIDCLLNGREMHPSLEDCFQSIRIAEAVQAGESVDFE